jgi:hypothetical protein
VAGKYSSTCQIILRAFLLLILPGFHPGVIREVTIRLIDNQHFIQVIPVYNMKGDFLFSVISYFHCAIDGTDLIAQEMPPKMSFTCRFPAVARASIQDYFHFLHL